MRRPQVFLLLALPLLLPLGSCGKASSTSHPRVIVLGIDGLDPNMVREGIERGELPNFGRLAEQGMLADLGTSWPPQSPVAWSNFITGANPGKHGLFDFINLNRKDYGLLTSMSATEEPWLDWNMFDCIPLQLGATMERTRKFPAFWDVLADHGVPVAVHRIPANFPVDTDSSAVVFPDMGTPDLAGAAAGRASLWFERSDLADERGWTARQGMSYVMAPVQVSRLRLDSEGRGVATASAVLLGPPDGDEDSSQAVTFYLDTSNHSPILAADVEGHVAIAPLGDWSDWIPVQFSLACHTASASGYVRFMLESADPLAVYASPIQVDPWNPVMTVSSPADASEKLADAIGPYYTQGFPDAYKAYKVGVLDTSEFISESDTVLAERLEMLDYALDQFDETGGLLFFYTGAVDMRSHMLWHHYDAEHPHRESPGTYDHEPNEYQEAEARFGLRPTSGMTYEEQIARAYMQVDDLLGHLMKSISARWPETELLVISDHGFSTMRRVMNTNDWLVKEGYLVLKQPGDTGSIAARHDDDGNVDWTTSIVDWDKTRAFVVGFNGIIINRKGREPRGIVDDAQAQKLIPEIQQKLQDLKDDDGTPVFTKVLPATEVFEGPEVQWAPDIQLGFNLGYGGSDEAAEGKITGEAAIVDNDSRWSGSHLMDPDLVPGSLLVRRHSSLKKTDPKIEDVTATLYQLFSVPPPADMDGQPLF